MQSLKRVRLAMMKMMSERPLITIAYSTLPSRITSITYPSPQEDREVLVLVQNQDESSYVFNERSAKLIELKNRGVAKSRNAALDRASGKYLLFGDDDITFDEALSLISKAILPAQLSWLVRLMRPESPERIMFPKRRP
jgi:glycosyltransferase involved in cell wall biosynthesis